MSIKNVIKFTILILAVAVCLTVGLKAYVYYSTVYPLFATAGETCYALEPGTRMLAVGNRPDYLAAYVKTEAGPNGTRADVAICFLRPPVSNPNWEAK